MSLKDIPKKISKFIQKDPNLRFRYDPKLKVFKYLRGNLLKVKPKDLNNLQSICLNFFKSNSDLFGSVSEYKLILEHDDAMGGKDVILQQYHGPSMVHGGSIRFHVNKQGFIDTVKNEIFPDLNKVPRKPKISPAKAVKVAQEISGSKEDPQKEPRIIVYRHEGKPYLTWEVILNQKFNRKEHRQSLWFVYVDAMTGKVLLFYDNIQTIGPVLGLGTGQYSGGGNLNAWFNGTTYQLRDTTRTAGGGPEIITNDEDGASPSEDADNNWNDLSTSPRDQNQGAEVDAHRYVGVAVNYFQTVHGRNSFDGSGGNVVTLVHLGNNFSNGYWDGIKINLGDGTGVAATGDNYECSDDWLAHELTHAYTQYTCNLVYMNESGALNESFSDIFAAFITGDWLVFEDTWLKASAPAWRNMIDPTNGGQWNSATPIPSVLAGHQPSHYSVRYTGTADNGGVHINSGIINNLFYLLTVGGTHTVSGISVSGIGQSASEQMLFRCMTVNLITNPNATFLQFREAMLDACLDLFPTDLFKLSQVKNAFNAVGIGPDIYIRDNLSDTGLEPFPGNYLWASPDIINRNTPSPNPTVEFADLTNDSLWQNVEYGQDNYIYVRLQNRGSDNGDATINLYFLSFATFGNPSSWIHIGTLTETSITPGSLRISGPLTFPQALIPAQGHYCMVAIVSNSVDPAPDHTLITSLFDYLNYVRNTNNIAYRNMDVVDEIMPGTPYALHALVQTLSDLRERYKLRIDIGRFVPGARIRIIGPKNILGGAIARRLKLVNRIKNEYVYEVLTGKEWLRTNEFAGIKDSMVDVMPGFDNVLVEKSFELTVEYIVPQTEFKNNIEFIPKYGYELSVKQLWYNELIGSVGIRTKKRVKIE